MGDAPRSAGLEPHGAGQDERLVSGEVSGEQVQMAVAQQPVLYGMPVPTKFFVPEVSSAGYRGRVEATSLICTFIRAGGGI